MQSPTLLLTSYDDCVRSLYFMHVSIYFFLSPKALSRRLTTHTAEIFRHDVALDPTEALLCRLPASAP